MKKYLSIITFLIFNIYTYAFTGSQYATCNSTGCDITLTFPTGTADMTTCSNATLVVEYAGDFGAASETFTIYGEGSTNLGTGGTVECGTLTSDRRVYTITAAQINSWNNNGSITIVFNSTTAVNYCTPYFQVNAILSYNDDAAGNESTPTCSNQTFSTFGFGEAETFAVLPNTYYFFNWSGGTLNAGFCADPNSGANFTTNQASWFSGAATSVRFYAKKMRVPMEQLLLL